MCRFVVALVAGLDVLWIDDCGVRRKDCAGAKRVAVNREAIKCRTRELVMVALENRKTALGLMFVVIKRV